MHCYINLCCDDFNNQNSFILTNQPLIKSTKQNNMSNLDNRSMISRPTQALTLDGVIEKLLSPQVDRNEKLEAGISYLLNLKASDLKNDAKAYLVESIKILDPLLKVFTSDEHYKPWVRYFDVAYKVTGNYYDDNNDVDDDPFATAMDTLVEEVLLPSVGGQISNVDWRVVKKILSIKQIFHKNSLLEIDPASLLKPLRAKLQEALDYLIWKDQSDCTILTRKTIEKLIFILDDESQTEKVKDAIISGRFDRNKFDLGSSAILGEDGGMYLLLNRVDSFKRRMLEGEVGEQYLHDKIKEKKDGKTLVSIKKEIGDRVEIGKGTFGIVRFALSLLETESKPGDLICVKKSRSFKVIRQGGANDFKVSPIDIITDSTLEDYFTSSIAKVVYAPKVYDMALVINKNIDTCHMKGYLMMEVLPQNTGGRIFQLPEYQKWEYQKPYLLDVFNANLSLLSAKVGMTDLKPDNTLYDTDLRRATLIDLGGTVKVESYQHLDSFQIERYSIQRTPTFTAKELTPDKGIIDLPKAISYSCGKLASSILSRTDYEDKDKKLEELIDSLCKEDPNDRPRLDEAINMLTQMGDDSYQQRAIFSNYIRKVKERIKKNKSSISLNEDIFHTRDVYITQEATALDPYRYKNQKIEDLQAKIDAFFRAEVNAEKEVFLLLGAAGSGKSIVLQLKFVEAVNDWKTGDPLPIYFNLANGIELPDILAKLNQELKTDLSLDNNLKNYRVHLYVDSFDEGIGTDETHLKRRKTLLQGYIQQLGNNSAHKILISCRSDYLQTATDDIWFTPKSVDGKLQPNKLEKYFVAPITYSDRTRLEKNIRKHLDDKKARKYTSDETYTAEGEYYLRKMEQMNLPEVNDKDLENQRVHLYIESFDEGIGPKIEHRATLMQDDIKSLGNNSNKRILRVKKMIKDKKVREEGTSNETYTVEEVIASGPEKFGKGKIRKIKISENFGNGKIRKIF